MELLAARSLALLRSLTDYERSTFLDQCCERRPTRSQAHAVAARATFLAGASSFSSCLTSSPCHQAYPLPLPQSPLLCLGCSQNRHSALQAFILV